MENTTQNRLLELHEEGFDIHINNGYICDNVYTMHKTPAGNVLYSDSAMVDCPLDGIPDHCVDVYFKIEDWEDCDINKPMSL